MPIKYDSEKQGFILDNPTEEELVALEKIAIDYVTHTMGKMAAVNFVKAMSEEAQLQEPIEPKVKPTIQ